MYAPVLPYQIQPRIKTFVYVDRSKLYITISVARYKQFHAITNDIFYNCHGVFATPFLAANAKKDILL